MPCRKFPFNSVTKWSLGGAVQRAKLELGQQHRTMCVTLGIQVLHTHTVRASHTLLLTCGSFPAAPADAEASANFGSNINGRFPQTTLLSVR